MSAPTAIAHYRITAKLGEGGMGAVYRATDSRLNREVAIKVLPPAFAEGADRMQRFEREAQLLASLNHPHIAGIYGIEQGAIVMEFVDGAELNGPLPVDVAVDYARQIAAGLEAAHEKGIVHRDLKPANIRVTPEGVVKLLDFGLAKATESTASSSTASPTLSPTLSLAMTQAGVILGTAAYMSPEQARGKVVDKRADIWAFGVVLFEMLTGSMLYGGETVSDSMAAVITREPDWTLLPEETPPHIRRLLERCLRKDPKLRLRDIGEARILLDERRQGTPAAPVAAVSARRSWMPWALAAAALAAVALGVLLWRATRPVEHPLVRFSADMGPDAARGSRSTAAISPDGTRIVYQVRSRSGAPMLATRLLSQETSTILAGTENGFDPFFSPDGQWIGFQSEQRVKKVSVQGGAPSAVCELPNALRGADWGEDNNLVLAVPRGVLSTVPAAGGVPREIGELLPGEMTQRWPQILPGGAILMTAHNSPTGFDDANIEVLFPKTGKAKVAQRGGYHGRYLPSGHLVYLHRGTLFAVRFALDRYETRGVPVPILEDVAGSPSTAGGQFDFSLNGTFVYLPGASNDAGQFAWLDAAGKQEAIGAFGGARSPRLSPDGKKLAIAINGDLAVYDLERGSLTKLASADARGATHPVWMPDGRHIIYSALQRGLWWARADGSAPPQNLYPNNSQVWSSSVSPDGKRVAISLATATNTGRDIFILPLDASDPDHPRTGELQRLIATPGGDVDPVFSPDGKWLAYSAGTTGAFHVFVRPYPEAAGGQVQISTVPGRTPVWSRAAREIFYLTLDGKIMAVPYVINRKNFEPGKPRVWTPAQIAVGATDFTYDLAPDGKRFIIIALDDTAASAKTNLHLVFLLNFFDLVKQKVPGP